jgi:enoyl-CoA hydratase
MTESSRDYQTIRLDVEDSLTWIVLNRPEKRNAMSPLMLEELAHAVTALGAQPEVRVIGLRGEGTCFCAGYDIGKGYASGLEKRDALEEWDDLRSRMDRMMTIWDSPVPVIAAVHGWCLAGATQLCTFCDLVIVSDDAIIGSPGTMIGAGYVSPMFVLAVGMRRGKELGLIPGRQITGAKAAEWGWANWSVSEADLLDEVRAVARNIALSPRELVSANKVAMNRIADQTGFRYAVQQLADIDVIAHRSAAAVAAGERLKNKGPGVIAREFAAQVSRGSEKEQQ